MMDFGVALAAARGALTASGNKEAVAALKLLGERVERDALISEELKLIGPSANVRGRADKGVLLEYMGVQVIIAARLETPRDKGVWVFVSANKPRNVEVQLADWDPEMAVVPVADLDLIEIDDEGAAVSTSAPPEYWEDRGDMP
jgi:hypothetical protein